MDWNKAFPETNFNFEDEDIRIEKTVKTLTKSPEEIAKLTIDESLSNIDRAQLLITTGQEVQQVCAIKQLPRLLEYYNVDAMCRVVPQLMDILKNTSNAVNEAAASVFIVVVQKELVPCHLYISSFLPSILRGIESRDVAVNRIWMSTLLESICYLTKEVIKGDVVSIALAKGQLSQTVSSRLASCKIIGKICASKKVDAYWIKQDLLPLATSLCQDVDFEVRSCMCRQLDPIARSLGFNMAKSCIFHELIELSRDEEISVRIASLETLVDLLDFFEKNYIRDTIVPLFHKFFDQSFSNQDGCFKAVAHHIGKICYLLKGHLDDNEKLWFIHYYCKITSVTLSDNKESLVPPSAPVSCVSLSSTTDDMECELRHLCAYNIPAMVMFHGREKFSRDLLQVLNRLVDDNNAKVRQSIAYGIHEVAAILHSDAMKISPLYIKLMKDKTLTVLEGLIEHLPQALIEFSHAANLSITTKAPGLSEFIPGLLAMEQTCAKDSKWRLHSDLLNQFACLVHCMTSEQIYLKFVPLLFKYISISCVLPVKYAASQTLCMIIRHNRKQEQREELCRRIVDDCAHSNKHKLRLLYVDICKFVMELFSKSFFKQYFCEALLELAGDPVANVRLSVSHLLPNIKRSLKLPSDRMLVQLFDQTLRMLYSMENDTDVCYNVRHTLPELNRIEIAVESLSRKTTFMEDDLLDQKKEQEEKLLLLAEEQDAKEGDTTTTKGKQSTVTTTNNNNKEKQKNAPAKRFTLKPIKTSPALNRKSSNNSLPSSPVLSSTTAPLRTTSSANSTPTSNRRTVSPPLSGLANCLTSSSPSTTNPSSINTQPVTSSSSPTSAGNSPVGVMKKAVTIPKIVTPTGSPGVQRKESYQSSRAAKTPIPTETKSQPSLDSKSILSSPQSSRNSPSELRKSKLKDDKTTSRSAPSGSRRKPVSSTASTSGRSSKRT